MGDSKNRAWAEGQGVGKALLQRMGWKEGQGLGKEGQGGASAIVTRKRADQEAGLGFSASRDREEAAVESASSKRLKDILGELKRANTPEEPDGGDDARQDGDHDGEASSKKEKKKKKRKDREGGETTTPAEATETTEVDPAELERVAARRKKRYRKMHEAKDVSKYSSKAMDAIFGRPSKEEDN